MSVKVHEKLYIGGEWVDPATDAVIDVISPHTEEVVGRVPERIRSPTSTGPSPPPATRSTRATGRGIAPEERIAAVQRFSRRLRRPPRRHGRDHHRARWARRSRSRTSAQSPAPWMMLNTFIGIAAGRTRGRRARTGVLGTDVIVRREPVGVVAGIVPWNVPQFVTMSKLAPALLAGCTIVVKPAPETPLDSYLMAELLDEAGIPKGVVSILPAGREVGEHLVRHPGVDKVAFTGSTAAGRRIAVDLRRAAEARAASSSAASRPRSSSTTPTSRRRSRA